MTLQVWFWIIYVIALLFGFWRMERPAGGPFPFYLAGGHVLVFVLIGLLGWAQFGAPVK